MELTNLYITRHALRRFVEKAGDMAKGERPDLTMMKLLAQAELIQFKTCRPVFNFFKHKEPADYYLAHGIVFVITQETRRAVVTCYHVGWLKKDKHYTIYKDA